MRVPIRPSLAKSGLLLIALLPIQLATEFTIAYFSPRLESQLVTAGPDGQLRLAPVQYVLVDVPLTPFTRYLLVVTSIAFMLGVTLLLIAAVRKRALRPPQPSNHAMERTADRS